MTHCEDCTHMDEEGWKKRSPWQAMCTKFPVLNQPEFVFRGVLDSQRPYRLCRDINGGACPLFEERKNDDN